MLLLVYPKAGLNEFYRYSNIGTNIAGRIVEVVSGQPYEEFLQKRLFDPLGMTDTTFWPSSEQLSRLAKVYKPGAEDIGLEETVVSCLQYTLDNPAASPHPLAACFQPQPTWRAFAR